MRYRMMPGGVLGGGLGPREWVLNALVANRYARTDRTARNLPRLALAADEPK